VDNLSNSAPEQRMGKIQGEPIGALSNSPRPFMGEGLGEREAYPAKPIWALGLLLKVRTAFVQRYRALLLDFWRQVVFGVFVLLLHFLIGLRGAWGGWGFFKSAQVVFLAGRGGKFAVGE